MTEEIELESDERDPDLRCIRPDCGHAYKVHRDGTACRVTGCPCPDFAAKARKQPPPQSRRVCVDVPDGYSLSFSLIPWTAEDDDEEPES
jgi:hypothetical protein